MISDDELANHPDPRVDPGICGVIITHTAAGVPLAIERICIRPPHDTDPRNGAIGPAARDGLYPQSQRHYAVPRRPGQRLEPLPYEPVKVDTEPCPE